MTQENEPKGSKSPDGFSGKCEHPADGKAKVPLKKRVRFWGSDGLKEVTDKKTEGSSANHNDVKVSSTSGFTDAREEDKVEIIPIQKRSASTTRNDDEFAASLLQLAVSAAELEGTGNKPRVQGGGALDKESKKLIEHTAAGGSGSGSQTDTTVPPIRSGQRIEGDRLEEVQEGVTNDGSDGSSAPSGEEQSKGKIIYRRRRPKQSSSPEENPVQDQSAPEVESGFSGDGLDPVSIEKHLQKTEGDGGGAFLSTDTAFDRSGEVERREEVQSAEIEEGEISDDVVQRRKEEIATEVDDDCSGDAPDVVGEDEQIPKAEGVTKGEDGGGAISATVECETDRIYDVQEAAVKDGDDGNHARSGEPINVNNKVVEDHKSEMNPDGDTCGKDEMETEDDGGGGAGGNGSFSPTNTITEGNNSENAEDEEQGKHAAMEDDILGNNSSSAPGIEEPMEGGEKPLGYVVSTIDHDRNIPVEADQHEQGQLVAMEDGGNGNNKTTSEPGVQEQSDKGKEPVEALHYDQQGQRQTAIEDGGGNAADVVVSREEVQDRKGKKPMEYYEGFRKYSESKPVNNQNAPDVVGNKEQPNHQGRNPNVDGGSGSGSGPPTFLVTSESGYHNDQIQQAAFEDPDGENGNKNTDANMAIQGGMQSQQDAMLKTILDIIIRKRRRSIGEQGEVSHDVGGDDTPGKEGRKKCKYGSDHGGSTSVQCLDAAVGCNEPPMQHANHSVMLFGVTIPCEQDPDVAINTNDSNHAAGGELGNVPPPMQQPTNGAQQFDFFMAREPVQPRVQLFGVCITGEQVQPVEMQNRDQGNSRGRGESSRQRLKSGLRLFGVDI